MNSFKQLFNFFSNKEIKCSKKRKNENFNEESNKKHKSLDKSVIYCRISSIQQDLNSQIGECIKYCDKNSINYFGIVKEVSSARSIFNLKKLHKIIDNFRDITIVIYSVDRICRNTRDAITLVKILEEKNIKLVSVVDTLDLSTASGKHQFRERMSCAELESDLISERVKRSISYKKSLGGHIGRYPSFGYKLIERDNIKIKVEDSYEQEVIKFITKNYNKKINYMSYSNNLYKLLKIFDKPEDFYVPVSFYRIDRVKEEDIVYEEEKKINTATVNEEMLCNTLNDYCILNRNRLWTKQQIKKIIKNYNLTINNQFYEMTI